MHRVLKMPSERFVLHMPSFLCYLKSDSMWNALSVQELLEMELRIRNGGLGGVLDYKLWETKVKTAQSIADLVRIKSWN